MNSNILFILSIPPPYGGGEIVSEFLYNKIKYDYHCIIYTRKKHSKFEQNNQNISSYTRGISYIFKRVINILKYKPEIIYIGLPKTFQAFLRNAIIIWISKLLKIKIFCELHGMEFHFIKNSRVKYKIVSMTLNKVQKIRVLSNSIKFYLESLNYSGKVYVIDNGIEKQFDISEHDVKSSKLNVLYLGAISNDKGFDKVLKIIKHLKTHSNYSIHLNVLGEYVYEDEQIKFENYIRKNSISSLISYFGHKNNEEKWEIIKNNDLLIHMTKNDGQPLSIIETMSLGIPTISTKIGAIPEMITHNYDGFLVDRYEEVASIIQNIIEGDIDYSLISKNAINTFNNKYTSEIMVSNILKMINE